MTAARPKADPDEPLRLADALALRFRPGYMTVSGLRRERDRGNLETSFIAGREFTTLAEIDRMIKRCQGEQKARGSTCDPQHETPKQAPSPRPRPGSFETAKPSGAQAALQKKLDVLKKRSAITSPTSTPSIEPQTVVHLTSRSPTC